MSYALLQIIPSRRMLGQWFPGEIQSAISAVSAGAIVVIGAMLSQ